VEEWSRGYDEKWITSVKLRFSYIDCKAVHYIIDKFNCIDIIYSK
jgi:hypothetical protein